MVHPGNFTPEPDQEIQLQAHLANNSQSKCSFQIRWLDLGLLISLIGGMILLAWVYGSQEHIFYYWDYAAYQRMAQAVLSNFQTSPWLMVKNVLRSLGNEYTYLFTLPLVLWGEIFGLDRISYILGVVVFYQIPFVLTVGIIATRLVQNGRRTMFWLAAWITVFTSMAWAPALRGYPDVSAALMIAIAIGCYLYDPDLKGWFLKPAIGLALTIAILLRRHFAYDVIAFFIAVTVNEVYTLWALKRAGHPVHLAQAKQSVLKIALTLLCTGLWMGLLGVPFLIRVFTHNYSLLYESYAIPISTALLTYLSFFGWQYWGISLAGYWVGANNKLFINSKVVFLIVFALISLLMWSVVIRNSATHYTLHLTLFILIGLAIVAWFLVRQPLTRTRKVLFAGLLAWLVCNAVIGLTPIGNRVSWPFGFSKNYAPLTRSDYDEVVGLVKYLRTKITEQEPIYVAASSMQLNDDLLKNAERELFKKPRLNFLSAPQVDSRDYYPLEPLLRADWVIVATPFQYHLHDPAEQKVVESVVKIFDERWDLAGDFELQSGQWRLEPEMTVRLYRRSQPTTTETAIRTYFQLAEFIGRRPVGQPDWIRLSPGAPPVQKLGENSFRLEDNFGPSGTGSDPVDQAYLYVNGPSPVRQIDGKWDYNGQGCPTVSASVEFYDRQGDLLGSTPLLAAAPGRQAGFSQPVDPPPDSVLVLRTSQASAVAGACRLQVDWTMFH
jgi:hypothetical protein